MAINFTNNQLVSTGQIRDKIHVKIKQPSVFILKKTMKPLTLEAFDNNLEMSLSIPP